MATRKKRKRSQSSKLGKCAWCGKGLRKGYVVWRGARYHQVCLARARRWYP